MELYLAFVGNLNALGAGRAGLVGMGGVGKTQLAIEFAYRMGFAFDAVYWIQGNDPSRWRKEFVALARDRLGLRVEPEAGEGDDERAIAVLDAHFRKHPHQLVVMDNVADPQQLNREGPPFSMTPLSLSCDLLFTTRQMFDLPGVAALDVGILSPAASMHLLSSYRAPRSNDDGKNALAICGALGHLPLALVLAGAYLREYAAEVSFATYLSELRRNRLDAIDVGKLSPEHLATRHDAAVRTTLRSQWDMLHDSTARHLFCLAG